MALLGLAACFARPKADRRGPFLSILRQQVDASAPGAVPPASIALALGGLPPEEMSRLRERLEESTEAALRRAAPMLFDLMGPADEDVASDPLRQALPDLPALTAAANMLGAPWSATGLSVKVGPSCETTAIRCVPLFASPSIEQEDAVVRRGRALTWALSNAALIDLPSSSRAAVLRSLREAQVRPSGTIALVFAASRGALDGAEVESLREQASRALVHLPSNARARPWLDALGAAPAAWELPIAMGANDVLVIPRLSVLARLQDFRGDVDRALRSAAREAR